MSCCYCRDLPQIRWLKTTQMCSFTVLEARSPRSLSWDSRQGVNRPVLPLEAPGENLSPCSFQLLEAACIPWLVTLPDITPISHSVITSPIVPLFSLLPLRRIPVVVTSNLIDGFYEYKHTHTHTHTHTHRTNCTDEYRCKYIK